MPAGQELPYVSIAATISIVHMATALAAIALAAFGALAAAGLIGYSPTRLAQHLDDIHRADKDQRIAELDSRDTSYLVVASLYTAAGWALGLWALGHAVDADSLPWAALLWILAMLFAAGSMPVAAAETRPERTVLAVLPLLRPGFHLLRWPLVVPLLGITSLMIRVLRLQRNGASDPAEVQKQVMAAVADSVTADNLPDAERTWIGNIVGLKDLQVSTVMTPRPDVVALPDSITLQEAVDQALEHGFSRYPVYRERIDEVVGIFYAKDALAGLRDSFHRPADTPLRGLLREPIFVPETTRASRLLRRLQAANQHMAIVIDEYGSMVGVATIEDLLEEIVGDIGDEYDSPTEIDQGAEAIRVVEAGRVVEIPARTEVAEVNRLLGVRLAEHGDWDTVAGLVIAACNHIPAVGETVVVDGVEFRVLAADERRVQRLRVTALAPQTTEGGR